jgi:hypothetical protein
LYDSYMRTETYPLAVPDELLSEFREAAKRTGLSIADVIRQSAKLGLPKLVEELSAKTSHLPMSAEEVRRCYEKPNREFDELEHHMASNPVRVAPPEA